MGRPRAFVRFGSSLDPIPYATKVFEQDFITHDDNLSDVSDLIRSLGLDITLFQPFRDFEGLPDNLRAKAFDRPERKFDLMQELGTDLVLVCSSCHPAALGGIDRLKGFSFIFRNSLPIILNDPDFLDY
jgi:sugar phosphate isomerase/epimerase